MANKSLRARAAELAKRIREDDDQEAARQLEDLLNGPSSVEANGWIDRRGNVHFH